MKIISLECDEGAYHQLWLAANRRGNRVEVPRRALAALLRDHAKVLANPTAIITNKYAPTAQAGATRVGQR